MARRLRRRGTRRRRPRSRFKRRRNFRRKRAARRLNAKGNKYRINQDYTLTTLKYHGSVTLASLLTPTLATYWRGNGPADPEASGIFNGGGTLGYDTFTGFYQMEYCHSSRIKVRIMGNQPFGNGDFPNRDTQPIKVILVPVPTPLPSGWNFNDLVEQPYAKMRYINHARLAGFNMVSHKMSARKLFGFSKNTAADYCWSNTGNVPNPPYAWSWVLCIQNLSGSGPISSTYADVTIWYGMKFFHKKMQLSATTTTDADNVVIVEPLAVVQNSVTGA